MPVEILMPALSPTMEEGKLARWLVKEGDNVTSGMVVAEIETDKATMEVEAVDEGRVAKILIAEGTEGVKVNTPIAVLLEEGEELSDLPAAQDATPATVVSSEPPPQPTPTPAPIAAAPATAGVQPTTARSPAAIAPPPAPPPQSKPAPAVATNGKAGERVFASPLARRLAKEAALDLTGLQGSGPHGRIIKRDVESAIATGPVTQTPAALTPQPAALQPTAPPTIPALADNQVLTLYEHGSYDVIPHDGMRRTIAQRLTQSKQTIPHFYMSMDCTLDELLRARTRINEASPEDGPRSYKLSVNDFVIKAMALALQHVPAANATWTDEGMLQHRHSDIGVAVAVEGGLFTPIIRHAELKTLAEISNEMKDLAGRARKRRLAPHEYQGGTTSISNLGMYGIKSFDAVINPPHATILAVGAGEKRAVVVGDDVRVATIMNCTLSCDHRVVDGAVGADLLNAFRRFIEDPVRMLV